MTGKENPPSHLREAEPPSPRELIEPPESEKTPPAPKKNRTTKPAAEYVEKASPQKQAVEKKPKIEYRIVSFENYRGWKARYVDCAELDGWPNTPQVHEYLKLMGDDGWELDAVATGEAMYGAADFYQLFFSRRR